MRLVGVLLALVVAGLTVAPIADAHRAPRKSKKQPSDKRAGKKRPVRVLGAGVVIDGRARYRSGLPDQWPGLPSAVDHPHAAARVIKMVYAVPADLPDRSAAMAPLLHEYARGTSRYVALQSRGAKTLRWDLGTEHGSQYLDVLAIRLSKPHAAYMGCFTAEGYQLRGVRNARRCYGRGGNEWGGDAFALNDEVRAALRAAKAWHPSQMRYMVWVDGVEENDRDAGLQPGGEASGPGPYQALSYTYWLQPAAHAWRPLPSDRYGQWPMPRTADAGDSSAYATIAHELMHTLGRAGGAIEPHARHSDGGAHCTEDYDLMCYPYPGNRLNCGRGKAEAFDRLDPVADLAPRGTLQIAALDCGHDDYFAPRSGPIRGRPDRRGRKTWVFNVFDSRWLGSCAELRALCGA